MIGMLLRPRISFADLVVVFAAAKTSDRLGLVAGLLVLVVGSAWVSPAGNGEKL